MIEKMLADITLVDFGFATRFTPDLENLSDCCGTIDYMVCAGVGGRACAVGVRGVPVTVSHRKDYHITASNFQ